MRGPGEILLVSTYELGRPPLGVAWPAAFLREAGFRPRVLDLAVEPFDPEAAAAARLTVISAPMHTALRIALRAADLVRSASPHSRIAFTGLYAHRHAPALLADGSADFVLAGEAEEALVALAEALDAGRAPDGVPGVSTPSRPSPPALGRLRFPVPARDLLPGTERYARLERDGGTVPAAAVETTRGCLHLCRHCPIPPVYAGRFFAVAAETALADIDALARSGIGHVTFADADFLNGPSHAMRILRSAHAAHPHLTFDFTAKVEHLLRHRALLPEMAALGCLFVVSAVESLSDRVLDALDKGHSRDDVYDALDAVRSAGMTLRPSLLPFTPWSTLEDYAELLDFVEDEDLVDGVDPVHLSIRLLVPPGSLLLDREDLRPHLREFRPEALGWEWAHPDPRMDRLHGDVAARVEEGARSREEPRATFEAVREIAERAGSGVRRARRSARRAPAPHAARRGPAPRLTESWFC